MGAERIVRHLQLTAHSEQAVQHMLPRLEDALRCASLPDGGAPLLLVRHLALGDIPADMDASALAQHIEARFAGVAVTWVDGASADAESAPAVRFHSLLAAYCAVVQRLAQGLPCSAWYWPLVLRAVLTPAQCQTAGGERALTQQGLPALLASMFYQLAQWPEARVALPHWASVVAAAGLAPALWQVIDAPLATLCLRRAGWVAPTPSTRMPSSRQNPVSAVVEPPWWWVAILPSAKVSPLAVNQLAEVALAAAPAHAANVDALARDKRVSIAHQPNDVPVSANASAQRHAQALPPLEKSQPGMPRSQPPVAHHRSPFAASSVVTPVATQQAVVTVAPINTAAVSVTAMSNASFALPAAVFLRARSTVWPCEMAAVPTQAGGLLCLLAVLPRVGFLSLDETIDLAHLSRHILAQALWRLRVPADDPAWALVSAAPAAVCGVPSPALAALWSSPLLQAPRGRPQPLPSTHDAQVWLTLSRRWLRRVAHLGLASLVCRPAQIAYTATHIDVYFAGHEVNLNLRRQGLDSDPGWLPWFARVLHFHYGVAP